MFHWPSCIICILCITLLLMSIFFQFIVYVCVSTVRDDVNSADSDDNSATTCTVKSPLTPDASEMPCHSSSVSSLSSVGVSGKHKQSLSSHGHARHRSVDFALADIIPDLSETIDTDFLHAGRYYVFHTVQYRPMHTTCPYCCKAHAKMNRKMGNSTPCKIVPRPKNVILKLCIRDYVGEVTHHANFGFSRYSGGFSANRRNITTL